MLQMQERKNNKLSNLYKKEKMLCGYLEDNIETSIDGFGLHCEIVNQKCVCEQI